MNFSFLLRPKSWFFGLNQKIFYEHGTRSTEMPWWVFYDFGAPKELQIQFEFQYLQEWLQFERTLSLSFGNMIGMAFAATLRNRLQNLNFFWEVYSLGMAKLWMGSLHKKLLNNLIFKFLSIRQRRILISIKNCILWFFPSPPSFAHAIG